MKATEQDRLDLRQELERVFENPRLAKIAMDAMPPIDYDRLATKDEMNGLGTMLRGEMAQLRGDVTKEIAGVQTQITGLRGDVTKELAGVQTQITGLKGDIAGLRADMAAGIAGLEKGTTDLRGGMATEILGVRSEIADFRKELINTTRQMWAGQLATVVILVGWVAAVT